MTIHTYIFDNEENKIKKNVTALFCRRDGLS